MNKEKKIAILESSRSNEFRIPVHPNDIIKLEAYADDIYLQENYASKFNNFNINEVPCKFNIESRDKLLSTADIIVLLKPTKADLETIKNGATLIGWCHAIQQVEIAKLAEKKKLTLIAMEKMYENNQHLFAENNFISGREGVEHALSLSPIKYTASSKIVLISYGNVSKGALIKLQELGFNNIHIYTSRKKENIEQKLTNVKYDKFIEKDNKLYDSNGIAFNELLKNFDIIINGIKQDPVNPHTFLTNQDLKLMVDKLIIDLSCDDHMGFEFSHETTWENPVICINQNYYYSIPNIPSIVWDEASSKISEKLTPIICNIAENGPNYSPLLDAIEIKNGVIINSKIIDYQKKLGLR